MAAQYNAGTVMTVDIDLSRYEPQLGDSITVTMALSGYTNDTVGKTATFTLGPYVLDHTDIALKKVRFANSDSTQPDAGFTPGTLGTLLSGYSGTVQYDYTVYATGKTYRCNGSAGVLVNVSLV